MIAIIMKRWVPLVVWPSLPLVVLAISIWSRAHDARAQPPRATWGAEEGKDCIQSHTTHGDHAGADEGRQAHPGPL